MRDDISPRPWLKAIPLPSRSRLSHRPTTQIQELVALSYGVHPRIMTIASRDRAHAWPRQVAMYLTRQLTSRSLPSIGMSFHRDHSTVLYAVRKVEALMKTDPFTVADVLALREALEG